MVPILGGSEGKAVLEPGAPACRHPFAGSVREFGFGTPARTVSTTRERVVTGVSTVSTALGLQGRATLGGSRCQTGKGCSSKSANSEQTCSTFLLPSTLYRWTESVT